MTGDTVETQEDCVEFASVWVCVCGFVSGSVFSDGASLEYHDARRPIRLTLSPHISFTHFPPSTPWVASRIVSWSVVFSTLLVFSTRTHRVCLIFFFFFWFVRMKVAQFSWPPKRCGCTISCCCACLLFSSTHSFQYPSSSLVATPVIRFPFDCPFE